MNAKFICHVGAAAMFFLVGIGVLPQLLVWGLFLLALGFVL